MVIMALPRKSVAQQLRWAGVILPCLIRSPMMLSSPLLVLAVVGGLAFLVWVSLAILDRFEDFKLKLKEN